MKRRIIALIIAVFACISVACPASAHPSAGEHWQDIRYVLFGDKYYGGKDTEAKHKRQAIEYAVQICIDQFGNSHSSMLIRLQKQIPRLSSVSIDAINVDARPTNHREYTHRGWEFSYSNDARNADWVETRWPKRQDILRATIEDIFNFNGMPAFIDPFLGYDEKCENFCALVYYIHIIGDHLEFNHTTYNKSNDGVLGKDQVIPLGGTRGITLIKEILAILPVLFPDQDYSKLERELNEVNSEISSVLNDPQALMTEEGFKGYHDQAAELLKVLQRNIPNLLKNEPFFSNVFY